MTPIRLMLLRDRRTLKSFWVRLTGGAMPSLVNPDGPEETQDRKGRAAPTTQAVPRDREKPRPN